LNRVSHFQSVTGSDYPSAGRFPAKARFRFTGRKEQYVFSTHTSICRFRSGLTFFTHRPRRSITKQLGLSFRSLRYKIRKYNLHGLPPPLSGVYFLQAQCEANLIKIGFTDNLRFRVKDLRSFCPVNLKLLGLMPGPKTLEGETHRRFYGLRQHSEWFLPAPELLQFIKEFAPLPTEETPEVDAPLELPAMPKPALPVFVLRAN